MGVSFKQNFLIWGHLRVVLAVFKILIILASVPNWNGGKGEVGTFENNKISQKSCNSQNYIVLTQKNSFNFENSAFTTFFLDVTVTSDFDIYKSPGRGLKFEAKYFFSLPNVLRVESGIFQEGTT